MALEFYKALLDLSLAHLFWEYVVKKIISALIILNASLGACQKIIDCRGEIFQLSAHEQAVFHNNCQTYREFLSDFCPEQISNTLDLQAGQRFLTQSTLRCLIASLHSYQTIESIRDPKKLIALVSAAEYLQAPKNFMRKLWSHSKGKFNHSDLKGYEPEFSTLGNQLFSFGEYSQEYYLNYKLPASDSYYSSYIPCVQSFKMESLNGLIRIGDTADCQRLQQVDISSQKIAEFNLKQFTDILPHLTHLNLSNNKISILKKQHFEGMPANFYLSLEGNPIKSIEKGVLSAQIIRDARGSTIELRHTNLEYEQLEPLKEQWSLRTEDAHVGVFFTHLLTATFVPSCIAMASLYATDMNHLQKCKRFDAIDNSIIVFNAVLSTLYLMYCCSLDIKKLDYSPESIVWQTSHGRYQLYNDSFMRHFWEYFKYSLFIRSKKNAQ